MSEVSLSIEVANRLREMIIEGELPPASRLSEKSLCEALSVSRTPLREAIKVLASEGFVELLPNRGARIAALSEADVQELFDIAGALESLAAELAAERITVEDLVALKTLHFEMVDRHQRQDLLGYYRLNREIHETVVKIAGNAQLARLYEQNSYRIRRARFVVPIDEAQWNMALLEHEALINALERRDKVTAATILKQHLRNKSDFVRRAGYTVNETQL